MLRAERPSQNQIYLDNIHRLDRWTGATGGSCVAAVPDRDRTSAVVLRRVGLLVLLSQSVAAFVDRNHIFEKTHFSAWGG